MKQRQATDKPSNDYGRVAVIYGGNSAEREISLLSGQAVFDGLLEKGINAVLIDSRNDLYQQLKSANIDRAFIALHGRDGEDGVIQGFLKTLSIPYTGSNTESCAIAMNKLVCKQIWRQIGLPTADFHLVGKKQKFELHDAERLIAELGDVLFVKPIREGSSVGMSKTNSPEELVEAVSEAQNYDPVLIETFVQGDEYTVSILEAFTLPSIRMTTPREFYDYEAKYRANTTEYFCPSGLTKDDESQLQALAQAAFNSIGCSGWGRVDFIRCQTSHRFELLEVNTIPGMTKTSLVPKAAKSIGMDFPSLVERILHTSMNTREAEHE